MAGKIMKCDSHLGPLESHESLHVESVSALTRRRFLHLLCAHVLNQPMDGILVVDHNGTAVEPQVSEESCHFVSR